MYRFFLRSCKLMGVFIIHPCLPYCPNLANSRVSSLHGRYSASPLLLTPPTPSRLPPISHDRYTPLGHDATTALRKRSTATGIPLSPSVPIARQTHSGSDSVPATSGA